MEETQKILHGMGIRKITFKDHPDSYQLKLLSGRECSVAFSKALALLAPPCTAAYDSYQEYNRNVKEEKRLEEEGFEPEEVDLSLFDVSVVLSQQMEKPLFHELVDILLKGLTKNGEQPVDLDNEFRGRFDSYLKLVEYAFMENLGTPFVRWLEEKGFSGMSIYLQQAVTASKGTTSN